MRIFLFLLFSFALSSCVNNDEQASTDAFIIDRDVVTYGEDVLIKWQNGDPIDSIHLSLNGQQITVAENQKEITIQAEDFKLGSNSLLAELYRDGQVSSITDDFAVYPSSPKQYSFKLINAFKHDSLAYTQGLEWYNGVLYESTGAADGFISSIRKIDVPSGKVLQKKEYRNADASGEPYFMEGITFANDKLVLLTYLNGHGFILNPQTFQETATFNYGKSRQGWGICFDGEKLIKSDGTAALRFLDANSYQEIGELPIYDNNGLIDEFVLNELEYVDGKVYANSYGKDEILIIDPRTGIVEGQVHCIGLHRSVAEQNKEMNGIAYNKSNGNFYVTGKQWNKLYEIAIVER